MQPLQCVAQPPARSIDWFAASTPAPAYMHCSLLRRRHSTTKRSGKYSDAIINALKSPDTPATAVGYRTTSPSISNKYYHPTSCVYRHEAKSNQGLFAFDFFLFFVVLFPFWFFCLFGGVRAAVGFITFSTCIQLLQYLRRQEIGSCCRLSSSRSVRLSPTEMNQRSDPSTDLPLLYGCQGALL